MILDDIHRSYSIIRCYVVETLNLMFTVKEKVIVKRIYGIYCGLLAATKAIRKIEFIKGFCRPLPLGMNLDF